MNAAREVVTFLQSRGLTMATAESCTAGLVASLLAEIPGSGACLDVGIVVYSPEGKCGFLGVRPETIDEFGLTSEEVAREMAQGILAQEACKANVAVANTGLAGPPPQGSTLAPGTQCYAWSFVRRGVVATFSETKVFPGDRNEIRRASALYVLSQIAHYYGKAVAGN
jgi:PncC family amidohydrolase